MSCAHTDRQCAVGIILGRYPLHPSPARNCFHPFVGISLGMSLAGNALTQTDSVLWALFWVGTPSTPLLHALVYIPLWELA